MYVLVVVTLLITETEDNGIQRTAQNVSMQDFADRRTCSYAQRSLQATAPNITAYCFEK